MNENINLVEILKDAPIGIELYSPLFGKCIFEGISYSLLNDVPIMVSFNRKDSTKFDAYFTKNGHQIYCDMGECLLFPSKDNRDWSTFKAPWKQKQVGIQRPE